MKGSTGGLAGIQIENPFPGTYGRIMTCMILLFVSMFNPIWKWRKMMKHLMNISMVLITGFLVFGTGVTPAGASAGRGLQYSCDSQVYEAFEDIRLTAFTRETGIPVDLFVAASNSCIYRVMQDMTDVAGTARPIYPRHKDFGLLEIPFCRDPLAVITRSTVGIDNLSTDQLRSIFAGRIDNWKAVGGPDLPITLVIPGKKTGAHKCFRRMVMKHKDMPYDYLTDTSARVLEAVETLPPGAVSFISRGARVSRPGVKVLRIDGKKPGDKTYPYYQVFYLVSKGAPTGSVKAFAEFINSRKGQSIILERGMLPFTKSGGI